MNLGAVIRSSYFLGVDQLFVVKDNRSDALPPLKNIFSMGKTIELSWCDSS